MNQLDISRRAALGRAGGLLAVAGLGAIPGSALLVTPAYADPSPKVPERDDIQKTLRRLKEEQDKIFTGKPSPNGWEMEKLADRGGSVWTRPVPGTEVNGAAVRLAEVENLLFHVVRRFHYEIDLLRKGDVTGWEEPGKVHKGLPEGNLASGTAIRIRPGHYPAGPKGGGFFPHEMVVIRDILAELDGVVRWGGDDRKPDEALFYLTVGPGDRRLSEIAARLRRWDQQPDAGPGTEVDVLDTKRRGAAKSLENKQLLAGVPVGDRPDELVAQVRLGSCAVRADMGARVRTGAQRALGQYDRAAPRARYSVDGVPGPRSRVRAGGHR